MRSSTSVEFLLFLQTVRTLVSLRPPKFLPMSELTSVAHAHILVFSKKPEPGFPARRLSLVSEIDGLPVDKVAYYAEES